MKTKNCYPSLFFLTLLLIGFSCQNSLHAQGSPDAEFSSNNVSGSNHATMKILSDGYTSDTTELKFTNMSATGTGTEFVIRSRNETGLVFSSNSDLLDNNSDNILRLRPNGEVAIGQFEGTGQATLSVTANGTLQRGTSKNLTLEESLNNESITINTPQVWQPIGPALTITKTSNESMIEAELLSRVSYTSGTTNGVFFRVVINGQTPILQTTPGVSGANNIDFMVAKSYFTNLPAGTYTVRVEAQTLSGNASGVLLDTGGYGGVILATEHL